MVEYWSAHRRADLGALPVKSILDTMCKNHGKRSRGPRFQLETAEDVEDAESLYSLRPLHPLRLKICTGTFL